MQYIISFLEGIITFISPCLLPMLPIYLSFFAGGKERTLKRTLICALGFVLGFTVVFTAMGALAGTVGSFLRQYQTAVNLVSGLIVILRSRWTPPTCGSGPLPCSAWCFPSAGRPAWAPFWARR